MTYELKPVHDRGLRFTPRFIVRVGVRRSDGSLVIVWSGHPRTQTEADHLRAMRRVVTHWYHS